MKTSLLHLGLAVLLVFIAGRTFAGEVLDRLVAAVNNQPILQSDWDRAVAVEALEQAKPLDAITADERHDVLKRLIDQQLLRSQMGDSTVATADKKDIAKQVAEIRSQYPQAANDASWHDLLAQYGLSEALLEQSVAAQLQVMRFVDLRLGPEARISRADVETYYTDTLVPAVRERGAQPESLPTVYSKIEEVLRQQRIDALLTSWLQDLRNQSDIQLLNPPDTGTAVFTSGGH